MRKIHSILLTTLLVLSTFSTITYTSCKQDKCKDVSCQNGGGCAEGVCVCPTGYTGTLCQNAPAPDPCANVVCQNGGTCNNGTCGCIAGFEGTNCQVLSRDKFIGIYTGAEQCSIGNDTYAMSLIAHSDNTKLTLINLYNDNYTATCSMTGNNTFTFSGSSTGNITYSGTGSIINNQLTVDYQISDGTSSYSCVYTGNK